MVSVFPLVCRRANVLHWRHLCPGKEEDVYATVGRLFGTSLSDVVAQVACIIKYPT